MRDWRRPPGRASSGRNYPSFPSNAPTSSLHELTRRASGWDRSLPARRGTSTGEQEEKVKPSQELGPS